MNVCLVSGEYPPENGWGGIATYTYYMARALTSLGHRVFVVALVAPGARACRVDGGVTVHRVSPANAHYYLYRVGLRAFDIPAMVRVIETQIAVTKAVKRLEQHENLHVVEYADSYAAGRWHKRFCRTPYVVKLHTPSFVYDGFYRRNRLRAMLMHMERSFITRAAMVTSPSRFQALNAARWLATSPTAIHIIPNPIDTDEFSPCLGEKNVDPRVLYSGWLSRLKGADTFAAAVPIVSHRFPRATFRLAGKETDALEDLPCRQGSITALLRRDGVEKQVHFLGFVPRSEMPQIYRDSDVCVVPSRFDNFPYSCLEAAACGKALVGSEVGGIPELVSHCETGILVPKDDPKALADGITRLLLDDELRCAMGKKARAHAVQRFALRPVAEQTADVYARVAR